MRGLIILCILFFTVLITSAQNEYDFLTVISEEARYCGGIPYKFCCLSKNKDPPSWVYDY